MKKVPDKGSISEMVSNAVMASFEKHRDLHTSWMLFGLYFGGEDDHLRADVYRLGQTDVLLRTMEHERRWAWFAETEEQMMSAFMVDTFQTSLSVSWVLGTYEVLRLKNEREPFEEGSGARQLLDHLSILRMPLVKGAIAKTGTRGASGRPHRASFTVDSSTGSSAWEVKSKDGTMHQISRLELSERFLALSEVMRQERNMSS